MGSVRRKTNTKKFPENAELFIRNDGRFARWVDGRGQKRTAKVTVGRDGLDRIVVQSKTYTAKYRDADGVTREVATGCRDIQAARAILQDLETRAEKVKAGIVSSTEDRISKHQRTPIADHIAAYMTKLDSDDTSADHRDNVSRSLNRIFEHCGYATISDFNRESAEGYFAHAKKRGASARTRNLDRSALVAFCNWCIETNRMAANPFNRIKKANEEADRRLIRRTLAVDEIERLLDAARHRPLIETMTIRTGKNKGQLKANVRPEVRTEKERLGYERALIYASLIYTGLRKSELASLAIGQVVLDVETAHLVLNAADEKARRGAHLPLHPQLAKAIRLWIEERTKLEGELREDTPLFYVPTGLDRIFNRDLELAGIAKRDALGRVVDVHSLRHCHASLLAQSGVAPAVAQKSMRHSDIRLTMDVYTHVEIEEVAGAVSTLPSHILGGILDHRPRECERPDSQSAPESAPKTVHEGQMVTNPGNLSDASVEENADSTIDVSACPDKRKRPLTTGVNDLFQEREKGFEPSTSSLGS